MKELAQPLLVILGFLWIYSLFGGTNQPKLFRLARTAAITALMAVVKVMASIAIQLLQFVFITVAVVAVIALLLWIGFRRRRQYQNRHQDRFYQQDYYAPGDPRAPLDLHDNHRW